ncbi:peptidoglycan-binding domain-containing protein [Streptomyces sp. NPDC002057]|uniref:peptidoglycan-binding domain-containing protein n=1 Tax=Streptomyces sp. NPDC002057 TaxID=3154664 RepID=UPI0033270439
MKMQLKQRVAALTTTAAMVVGLGTAVVATATPASAVDVCMGSWYQNPALPYTLWTPTRTLSYNTNYDACVPNVQSRINQIYGNVLTVDGYYGSQTRAWVKRFQNDYSWCSFGVDGVVGRNTHTCLGYATDQAH